jgi:cytidylate kinase
MSAAPLSNRKVIVIAGPTAVGKSNVAAKICANNCGLIVSADSVQAYRGVQIGANKPSQEEQQNTPHILVDIANHNDNYNAADWSNDAILAIESMYETEQHGENIDDPRRKLISQMVADARSIKGYAKSGSLLPVVCGGKYRIVIYCVRRCRFVVNRSD